MNLNKLFTGVAGIAIASTLAATAPAAEAQVRSPVQSSMQPQSTFTPPAGATVYRQNPDGSSTRVSPQQDNQPTQNRSDAYYEGRAASEYEAQRNRESDNYYSGRGPDNQIGCGATYNGGSWLNRGIGSVDRRLGSGGREIAGVLGMRGSNVTADMQAQCRINSLPEGDQRDRAQGRYDRHQEERDRLRLEREASRRIFGRSP